MDYWFKSVNFECAQKGKLRRYIRFETSTSSNMPRSFLVSAGGIRREQEQTTDDDELTEDDSSCHAGDSSHNSSLSENTDTRQQPTSTFCPSMSSAFSKIEKSDSEPEAEFRPAFFVPPTGSASSFFPGFYPGFYPPLFSSHMQHGESVATSAIRSPPEVNDRVSRASADDGKNDAIPEKNMYYYVDPRIPFTNYFLNLTKLLSGSSKDYNDTTTPLTKLGGEETRADDREPAVSPQSTKSPRSIFSPQSTISPMSTVSSPEKRTPSRHDSCTSLKLNAEAASGPSGGSSSQNAAFPFSNISDKFVTGSLDPRFMSPFAGSLHPSVVQQQESMFHLAGTSIFHPALLPFPGGPGLRRFNPDKPAAIKKYKCDTCGKAFSRSNTLVTHKRIHTGDKPFKCEVCSRAFRQPGNLTRHRLTHTTVKPYVCPTCNKAFNRASNLHTHMRTHNSYKSYVCPYCGKGFEQKVDMKIHCYTHTAHLPTSGSETSTPRHHC